MKLRTKLMMFTAAAALSANMAFAAIDPQALADAYIAEGYTYVEVKVGPTQTKLEAIRGDRKVEVIYDNETGAVLKQEFEDADADDQGRTGTSIRTEDKDFLDDDDDEGVDDEDDEDDEEDNDEDDDDEGDDEEDDEDDDDEGEDESDDEDDDDHGESDESDEDDDGEDGGGKGNG
jgi:Mg-chelatase subunit ChlI